MTPLKKLKTRWIQARIAYHRRRALSYSLPVPRSHRREHYHMWLRNMARRHAMRAHDLEQQLVLSGERV
jgi:hypothetical protein